jgi:hypothetical protein
MIEAIHNATTGDRDDSSTDSTAQREVPATTTQRGTGNESTADRSAESGEQPDPVHLDQVFGILKNQRRRSVLRYMQSVDDEVRLGELSEQIAAWECDKPVAQITSSERKRVYVGLYQSHLPKMDDIGAIEYNKQRGKIKPGPNIETFQHYLPEEEETSTERTWSEYHTRIAMVALGAALAFVLIAAL